VERIADAFVWPFRDPDWLGKIAIIGLILLIPVIGGINGLGWMLAALDRLRTGEERLPPANFDYLGKGVELFVVYLVYYLVLVLAGMVLYVPAIFLLSLQGHDHANALLVVTGIGLLLLTISVVTLGALALTFAMPSIVLAVDRGGIAAGLRVRDILRRMRVSPVNTLIAGLMLIAAGLVSQAGSVACVFGVVFTSAYALAMQAWIIRSYEEQLNVGPAAAASER
jgi:CDP-diglyceride synthetase